ncbi:ATP-dependent RNA helicase of the SFI superfamily, required for nonsense mediated mRNA decay and for, partial [Reticulomyxa filosa]
GLQVSLFERLVKNGRDVAFLDTQYRMHPSLSEFSSIEFYDGRLKSASVQRTIPKGFPWPVQSYPLCFVDLEDSQETRMENMSLQNEQEADLIVKIVQKFDRQYNITIITPYRAQKYVIQQKLGRTNQQLGRLIDVNTVDGFQGNESDIVIFSAVRCNQKQTIGFLKDKSRLNVLLTRAKSGLVVVGNFNTLYQETLWKRWLQHVVEKNKSFIKATAI